MQKKSVITSIAIWLLLHNTAVGQNLLPDKVPSHPVPQTKVNLLLPFNPVTPVKEMLVEYDNSYSQFADNLLETAMGLLGARYSRGCMGPRAFDCSGFTTYVYKLNNVSLLRSSRSQFTQGKSVKQADLHKGDLVFFSGSRNRRTVGHVGIVTDTNPDNNAFSFIHASDTGVIISKSTEPYYSARYMGARRIEIN